MTSVCGNYVKTFAEATHALPDGMHMNADYPLMLPRIERLEGNAVRLVGAEHAAKIKKTRHGQEYCEIAQSSTYEALFRRQPKLFRFFPFKADQ